jgi:tetrahydromethanopterin S-methyltransferase subunit G
VKRFLRRAQSWIERRALAQLHDRLDEIDARFDSVDARLDEIQKHVADAQAVVEAVAARAASSTEYSLGVVESNARTARRFEQIERMLGATPPGAR